MILDFSSDTTDLTDSDLSEVIAAAKVDGWSFISERDGEHLFSNHSEDGLQLLLTISGTGNNPFFSIKESDAHYTDQKIFRQYSALKDWTVSEGYFTEPEKSTSATDITKTQDFHNAIDTLQSLEDELKETASKIADLGYPQMKVAVVKAAALVKAALEAFYDQEVYSDGFNSSDRHGGLIDELETLITYLKNNDIGLDDKAGIIEVLEGQLDFRV